MDKLKIGIIGAGTMGIEIAIAFGSVGADVKLLDIRAQQGSMLPISKQAINKAKIRYSSDPSRLNALSLIYPGVIDEDFELLTHVDWIIEAVPEILEIKNEIFFRIETLLKEKTIITSNTSGISIRSLAKNRSLAFQRQFLGAHFFNPASSMRLVELIPSQWTAEATLGMVDHYLTSLLKKQCVISKDIPNFIVNRFLFHSVMGAIEYTIAEKLLVPLVDKLSGEWIGRPKTGTFGLVDLIGIDVWLEVCNNMNEEIAKYPAASELLVRMKEVGKLGRKTSRGFYFYSNEVERVTKDGFLNLITMEYQPLNSVDAINIPAKDLITRIKEIISIHNNSADVRFQRKILFDSIEKAKELIPLVSESSADVDLAIKIGLGHKIGPFELNEEIVRWR